MCQYCLNRNGHHPACPTLTGELKKWESGYNAYLRDDDGPFSQNETYCLGFRVAQVEMRARADQAYQDEHRLSD